eukprot:718287-Pelagomonas_calceolata.AAC.4
MEGDVCPEPSRAGCASRIDQHTIGCKALIGLELLMHKPSRTASACVTSAGAVFRLTFPEEILGLTDQLFLQLHAHPVPKYLDGCLLLLTAACTHRLAILGVTDQFILQRVDPAQYTQWRLELEDHVAQHNMEEEQEEDIAAFKGRVAVPVVRLAWRDEGGYAWLGETRVASLDLLSLGGCHRS